MTRIPHQIILDWKMFILMFAAPMMSEKKKLYIGTCQRRPDCHFALATKHRSDSKMSQQKTQFPENLSLVELRSLFLYRDHYSLFSALKNSWNTFASHRPVQESKIFFWAQLPMCFIALCGIPNDQAGQWTVLLLLPRCLMCLQEEEQKMVCRVCIKQSKFICKFKA